MNRESKTDSKRVKSKRTTLIRRISTALGAVVIFATTYALILPAITMEAPTYCGTEVHVHTSECYSPVLTCGNWEEPALPAEPETEPELICQTEVHVHDATCMDENGDLICGKEAHTHGEDCYAQVQTEPENVGHIHTQDCYTYVLTCQAAEHEHTLQCFSDPNADTDTTAWDQAADRAWENLSETDRADINARVLAVAASQEGYAESQQNYLVAEDGVTKYGYSLYGATYGAPYADWNALYLDWVLQKAAVAGFPLGSSSDEWLRTLSDSDQSGGTAYLHTADPRSGDLVFIRTSGQADAAGSGSRVGLVRTLTDKGIYVYEGDLNNQVAITYYDRNDAAILSYASLAGYTPERMEQPEEPAAPVVSAAPSEVPETLPPAQEPDAPSDEFLLGAPPVEEPAAEAQTPADAETEAAMLEPVEEIPQTLPELPQEEPRRVYFSDEPAEQVAFQELTEQIPQEAVPTAEHAVTADPDMIAAMKALEQKEVKESPVQKLTGFFTGLLGGPKYDHQATAEVNGVTIVAEYNDGVFPEDVTMEVRELSAARYEELVSALTGKENREVKSFDISFLSGGQTVEPEGEVKVSFRADFIETDTEPELVHIADNGYVTVMDGTVKEGEISGVTESFSVYVLSYTVDFHWNVDGKDFAYSIPGGGFLSFRQLVEMLGIATDDPGTDKDEIQEFLDEIADIHFSSPELVSVSKAEENTTVGAIKDRLGLQCVNSAELTEEEIAKINAQTVEAGDWAMIAVQPFMSEETLTVTMKNGNQFVVRVTDGQNVTEVRDIDADGFYVIYVDQYSNNTHHYYALRNDGASIAVPNNDLDALGAEYVWQFGYDDTACWWYNGSNYIEPEWSIVVGDNPDGRYLWIEKRGSGFGIHGNYWSDNYLSWDSSQGFKVVNTGFDVPIKVYERDKPRLNFSVAVNNPSYGSVSCSNTVTDLNWKNTAPIVATPADDCYFVGWRRGDEVLTGYSSTIPVGGIDITADNQVLTAIFGKNYTSPATQEINEWVDSLLGNPLESNKTAHVHDYDNRIYEIDLSASSSRYTIDQDIRIEFITDISRSMYFPETLMNEQDFRVNGQINLGQWLLNNGDPNQVYYVIGDINNTATMYAVYFSGNNYFTRWSIVDASYYLPYDNASTSGRIKTVCEISNGRTTINMTDRFDGNANRIFTGKIYNSTPKPPKDTADWDRLSYLTAAVNAVSRAIYRLDPGAEIGLVTFASSASGGTLYGAEDEASLISALHSIQPVGGTNQTSAFNIINNSNPPVFSLNSGKRQVALLITDGAPQGTSWDAIERAAGVTEGKDVEIWTLGLALDRVGNNKQRLMDLASDGGYSGNAEDPDQLVTETKKILQQMLVKATVIGEVYDTVDPAFYPVDSSGNPIEEGFYYADTAGGSVTCHSAAPSDVKKSYYHWVNDNGTWSIAYYNQEIKWPEDGGWKESFYVKAKEDFMGGNAISTNSGVDNRAEANRVKHSGSPEGYYWLNQDHSSFRVDYESPYVNVDELSMTENSTEWTVYLGTEVDPEEELKELWDKIRVNLVVKKNGINGDAYTVTGGSQMYYSDDLLNDAGSPDGTSNESLPLSHFVNGDLIETLLRQIKNGETTASSNLIYRYFPYGHSIIGTFELSLEKTVNQAAAEDDAPKQHETKGKGQEKEVYTLKVTYTPVGDNASTSYAHTTSGKSAGKVADGYDGTTGNKIDSENVHKIHVFAKDLEIQKKDMTNTSKLIDTAKFKLYRTAKKVIDPDTGMETSEFESDAVDLTVGNETKKVVQIGDEMTTSGGKITVEELSYAPDGIYYLEETQAPAGYIISESPMTIRLTLQDEYRDYKDPKPVITDISGTPYNWTQTVQKLAYANSKDGTGDDEKFVVEVLNNPGVELPATGGPGTAPIYLLGITLTALAGAVLFLNRRRRAA